MAEYVLRGPSIPIQNIHFQKYLFENIEKQDPTKVLLVDVETNEHITSGQFHEKCKKLAFSLSHYLKKEDTFAVVCENTWLSILPYFASLYLGSIVSMVNPAYVPHQLKENFLSYKPKIVFCSEIALVNVLTTKKQLNFIEFVVVISNNNIGDVICIDNFIENNCKDDNFRNLEPIIVENLNQTALILMSSGTTGTPKCVKISYMNLRAWCCLISTKYLNLNSSTVYLVFLPIFHIFGLGMILFAICASSKAIILKKFKPDTFLDTLEKYKVQMLTIVPTIAMFLAKSTTLEKYDLSHLNEMICGSSSLQKEITRTLKERLGVTIRQIYGCTETSMIAFERISSEKKNTCGEITPNMEVQIKDVETGKALPPYKKGELCVKGLSIFTGYINNHTVEDTFDEEGYYPTGDLAYYDEEGDIFIVDRLKNIIKYKGFQITPEEIESILLQNPEVRDVAVLGVPDERVGELPKAFIVKEPGSNISENEIISFLSEYSSSYAYFQNGVHFLDILPKNATGKTLKQNLRDMFSKT